MKAGISILFLSILIFCVKLEGQAPYCASGAGSDGESDILNVTIKQGASVIFTHNTTCGLLAPGSGSIAGRYANYRNLIMNLNKATTYTLEVTHTACGCSYNLNTRQLMYLDLNRNFVFDTPSERLIWTSAQMVNIGSSTTFTTSFSIPSNVTIDTTVMRIITYAVAGGDAHQCRTNYGAGETEDYTVTFCEPVTRNRTITQPLCHGQSNGKIKVVASGGRAPLQYAWNGGSYGSIDSLPNIGGGIHTLITRDSVGCRHYDTILVSQPSILVLNKQLDSSCQNANTGRITLNGSGGKPGYRYRLGTSGLYDTTKRWTGLALGTYIVSVRDTNLCIKTDTVKVDSFPIYALDKQIDTISCRSEKGLIYLKYPDPLDTTKYIEYSYNNGAFLPTTAGYYHSGYTLDSGTHIVRMKDKHGCITSDTTRFYPPPATKLTLVAMGHEGCNGKKGFIQVNRTGGSPYRIYQYYWSHINNVTYQDSFQNLTAGIYRIIVRDDIGCDTTSLNIEIKNISSRIIPSYSLLTPFNCQNDSQQIVQLGASGGAAPYGYSFFTLDYPEWSYKTYTFPPFGTKDSLHVKNTNPFKTLFIYVKIRDTNFCENDTAFYIRPNSMVYPSPTAVPNPSCEGDSIEVRMNLIETQYTQPPLRFSIQGQPFTTNTVLKNVIASNGVHAITIQHGNGCVDTAKVVLTTFANIEASFIPIDPSCIGQDNGSIRIIATGGSRSYTYTLNNLTPQSSPVFANLGANTYQVKVEDANGCKKTTTLNLNPVSYQLRADLEQPVNCFGEATAVLRVTLSGSSIQPGVLYSLNGSALTGQNTWGGLAAGNHSIRMQYNGTCVKDTVVVITEPSLLRANFSATATLMPCFGSRVGGIQLSPAGGTPPYSLFRNGQSNPVQNMTNLGAGSHFMLLRDDKGCQDTQTFVFTEPPKLRIDTSLVILPSCRASSSGRITVQTTGGTPPRNVLWSTGEIAYDRSGLSAGLYSISVFDKNLCSDSIKVLLLDPTGIALQSSFENISCYSYSDGKINISSNGGTLPHSYKWNDGVSNANRTNLKAGTYQVTVTDDKNCQRSEPFTLTEPNPITSQIEIKDATCPYTTDGSIQLRPTGGTTLTPTDFRVKLANELIVKRTAFDFLAPKRYEIKILDNRDCYLDTHAVVSSPPLVSIRLDSLYQLQAIGESITLSPRIEPSLASVELLWQPSIGLSCTDCLQPVFSGYTTQRYTLSYRYHNSLCGDSVKTLIRVPFADPTTIYIPTAFSPNGEGDPENETFKVYGPHILGINMKVFNRWGEMIYETDDKQKGWNGLYRGEPAPVGLYAYTLHIILLDGTKVVKTGEVMLTR